MLKLALHLLFLLSGAAALGYQLLWSRMFSTGLGHEMPAVLAVIAAFMTGLALGAFTIDRFIPRTLRAGAWLAGLEAAIGIWAVLAGLFIPALNSWVVQLLGVSPGALKHWFIVFAVPAITLLPATTAMGATLPAMEKFLSVMAPERATVARVYAANTFGAVAGTLLVPFALLPTLGLLRSSWALAAANAAVSATILLLIQATRARTNVSSTAPIPTPKSFTGSAANVPAPTRLSILLFATGLLGITYEAAGVRVLAQVLEGTIFTYAAVLSVFLLGTAAGAAAFHRWSANRSPACVLAGLFCGTGAAALLGMLALTFSDSLYAAARQLGDSVFAVLAAEMGTAASAFLLPTLFMGALFSALMQQWRDARGEIGRPLAANTIGAALAPLLAVALLPTVGTKWLLFLAALGYFIASQILLSRWRWLIPLLLLGPLSAFRPLQFVDTPPGGRVAVHKEGIMASVAVVEDSRGDRTLRVDNRYQMGGTAAADAEHRQAHLPLLLHPQPRRALFLGLGTGISFGAASLHPSLAADGVELIPEVVEAMSWFAPHNFAPGRNPALRIHVADARRYVRAAETQYDVIVGDVFHPYRDGAAGLYTREHFMAVRVRLANGGLFCQWLPLHQLDTATLQSITRTFLEAFPAAEAWLLRFNVDVPVVALIGRNGTNLPGESWVEQRVRDPQLGEALARLSLNDSIRLLGHFVAGPESLARFSAGAAVNTDDRPRITFMAARVNYRRADVPHASLFSLIATAGPDAAPPGLEKQSSKFALDLQDYIRARNTYLRGLVLFSEGRHDEAIAAYIQSARFSGEFTPGYAQCLSIASVLAGTDLPRAKEILRQLIEAQPARPVARQMLDRLEAR